MDLIPITISFGGFIEKLHVKSGDLVNVSQVIATINYVPLKNAHANSEAKLALDKNHFKNIVDEIEPLRKANLLEDIETAEKYEEYLHNIVDRIRDSAAIQDRALDLLQVESEHLESINNLREAQNQVRIHTIQSEYDKNKTELEIKKQENEIDLINRQLDTATIASSSQGKIYFSTTEGCFVPAGFVIAYIKI
ncbi:MAG: biotin/lipoyl-binding protein [Candidatus Thiodiazotropha sp.]